MSQQDARSFLEFTLVSGFLPKVNGMQKGYWNRAYIKPWLNQAARKKRRSLNRKAKAAKIAPRPTGGLSVMSLDGFLRGSCGDPFKKNHKQQTHSASTNALQTVMLCCESSSCSVTCRLQKSRIETISLMAPTASFNVFVRCRYIVGYALCRRPLTIAHCFMIVPYSHFCKQILDFPCSNL